MKYKLKLADKLWGQAMHRFYPICAMCANGRPLEAHHIIHRNHKLTRHDFRNGIMLCRYHHAWAHAKPRIFMEWMFEHCLGQWYWIQKNKNKTGKPNYETIIKNLKEVINAKG